MKNKVKKSKTGMPLSERALLVALHISHWGASKFDREVSEEVSERHKAVNNAGRYNKFLISKSALKEINSINSRARKVHETLTLPWEDNGTRIITTRGYMNYTEVMNDLILQHNRAVKKFLKDYPEFVEDAKKNLGSLFNSEDYPDVKTVKGKFGIDVEPKQVTDAGDFRAKVSDESAKAIAQDIERRSNERLEKAMSDVWTRITDVLEKLIDRMKAVDEAKPGDKRTGSLRDSVLDNIKDLADLLPSLNINSDPNLDAISKDLMNNIYDVYSSDELRKDSKLRAKVKKDAKSILSKVSDYMQ